MEAVKIKKITKLSKKLDRYDLTVSSTNNFFANGILIHNSSIILSNCKVKFPIKLPFYKKAINFIAKRFNKQPFAEYYTDYAEVHSSRKVIRNKELNPSRVGNGYYVEDNFGYWAEKLSGKIPKDMTVYGEIFGYEVGSTEKMIQKSYDYGAKPGEIFFMPYRITVHNRETDEFEEWNIQEVYDWTLALVTEYPELSHIVKPIDILYYGKFKDLYTDIPNDNKWHDNMLLRMSQDTELFGMEEIEPLCANKVPREGLVIRVDNDKVPRAYKLKTQLFRAYEKKQIDEGIVDSEITEGYE